MMLYNFVNRSNWSLLVDTTGANVIKLIFYALMMQQNELECLSLAMAFPAYLILKRKEGYLNLFPYK